MQLGEQWFANMLQIMGREKGLNYMKELSKQNITIRNESPAAVALLIASGEEEFDLTNNLGYVEELKKKGAPINWTTVGPTPAMPSGYGITNGAPHPNAARLFLDFVLSKEGQKIFLNIGRQIARLDLLQEQKTLKDLHIVPLDPSSGERMNDYAKEMRAIFKGK